MNKEMLDILNDLSKNPTTELALQIMELSSENLILEQENKQLRDNIKQMDNSIDRLQKQLIKEKDNWNKLKEFIVKEYYMYLPLEASTKSITILTNKMQELEGSGINDSN